MILKGYYFKLQSLVESLSYSYFFPVRYTGFFTHVDCLGGGGGGGCCSVAKYHIVSRDIFYPMIFLKEKKSNFSENLVL